ncbi:alpha/beta family hydrolase [Cryptosporangium sp. NPDC048952]|uniref:alpha/beta hydrolase family protein n=1 Tax=Cryptosporangium sp. NPDC048952 TaxID=3363961 RepID=UPI00371A1D4A
MAESHRSGRRTDIVHERTRPGGTGGQRSPGELTSEEPAGGLLQDVPTRRGPARLRVDPPLGEPRSLLVLGHGAGGNVDAPDLEAVTAAVVPFGVTVVRVTQPYRVAGRRAPAPANHLDEAWVDAVRFLLPSSLPLVVGGRSSGARVACRTAAELGAVGVVALAFPTHPPGKPERSRVDELPLDLPTLVLNGDRDPFGVPPIVGRMTLHVLAGADHSLKKVAGTAAAHMLAWLRASSWAR